MPIGYYDGQFHSSCGEVNVERRPFLLVFSRHVLTPEGNSVRVKLRRPRHVSGIKSGGEANRLPGEYPRIDEALSWRRRHLGFRSDLSVVPTP